MRALLVVLAVLALPASASAHTFHVHPGDSIQAAVDAADPGDRVVVHEGVYQEQGRPCPEPAQDLTCAVVITDDRIRLAGKSVNGPATVLQAVPGQDRGIQVGHSADGDCLSHP